MKKIFHRTNLIVIAAIFMLQIIGFSVKAQDAEIKKTVDNCDKMVMKNGTVLYVDIVSVDSSMINYVQCDSLEPQYSILKRKVKSIKYVNDNVVNTNDETYGKINTNSFGWNNYAEIFKAEIKKQEDKNKDMTGTKNNPYEKDRTTPRSTLIKLYENCPEAMKEYKMSKTLDLAGLAVIGGGCTYLVISYNSVTKKRNDEYTNWWNSKPPTDSTTMFDNHKYFVKKQTNAIIGLGITTVGAVLLCAGASHYLNSITIYNAKQNTSGIAPVQYDLLMGFSGVGVRMRF